MLSNYHWCIDAMVKLIIVSCFSRYIVSRLIWKIPPLSAKHCVKSVQIRSFFSSVFSRIRTEYSEMLRIFLYSVLMWENTDQKKLLIWTLFTQWKVYKLRVYFWFSEQRLNVFGWTFFLPSTVVEIASFLELQTMGEDRRLRVSNSAEGLRVL